MALDITQHRHLRRLADVWVKPPVYFITVCVAGRRPVLAQTIAANILREEWAQMRSRHGWSVGRYVVMPDHVHFFACASNGNVKPLSSAIGKWKEWTAKTLLENLGGRAPFWQPEFFDHVLRSESSRSEKWTYVRENPVRAGLVGTAKEWPFAGAVDFE